MLIHRRARDREVIEHYRESGSSARTAAAFGLSPARVRQLVVEHEARTGETLPRGRAGRPPRITPAQERAIRDRVLPDAALAVVLGLADRRRVADKRRRMRLRDRARPVERFDDPRVLAVVGG